MINNIRRFVNLCQQEGIILAVKNSTQHIRKKVFRKILSQVKSKHYELQYGPAAPDPYKIIYVDPDQIEYMLCPALRKEIGRYGTHIMGGSWDQAPIKDAKITAEYLTNNNDRGRLRFSNYMFHTSNKDHFINGTPWEETEWFQWYKTNLHRSSKQNMKEVRDYFNKIDKLYDKITQEGYKLQKEINPNRERSELDEIMVDIGRDGTFLFEDGRHRLSIAKILGLEQIPVRVLVRHSIWQEIRNRVAHQSISGNDNKSQLPLEHPDL